MDYMGDFDHIQQIVVYHGREEGRIWHKGLMWPFKSMRECTQDCLYFDRRGQHPIKFVPLWPIAYQVVIWFVIRRASSGVRELTGRCDQGPYSSGAKVGTA